MSNIRLIEHTRGYPFLVPAKGCSKEEFSDGIVDILERDNLISIAVQLNNKQLVEFNDILKANSFSLAEEEKQYELNFNEVEIQNPEELSKYSIKSYYDIGIEPFLEVTNHVSQTKRLKTEEGLKFMQRGNFNPKLWGVVYASDRPIALILCSIEDDGIGKVQYVAVIDEFQGKGIGKSIHKRAIILLKEHGAKLYRGGTSSDNKAMIKVFNNNGCKYIDSVYIYEKKI